MPEPLFQAELNSVRPLLTMLKAIQIKGVSTIVSASALPHFTRLLTWLQVYNMYNRYRSNHIRCTRYAFYQGHSVYEARAFLEIPLYRLRRSTSIYHRLGCPDRVSWHHSVECKRCMQNEVCWRRRCFRNKVRGNDIVQLSPQRALLSICEFRGENRDAVEICRLKTMEPEDEVIGLTMGQDVLWLQATLMKVGIVEWR